MQQSKDLVRAYVLDGEGSGREISFQDIDQFHDEQIWVHANYQSAEFQKWLYKKSGINEVVCEALIEPDTHPRTILTQHGLLVILRGADSDSTLKPEDLISMRMWLSDNCIISCSRDLLNSIDLIRENIKKGIGPRTVGECLVDVAENIMEKIDNIVDDVNATVDKLETDVSDIEKNDLRSSIASIRHKIIELRHYLTPQRDVLTRLLSDQIPWLNELDRMHLREVSDKNIRFIEDLEVARDDMNVLQEVLSTRITERVEHRMYVLSMVAAIFLPLGFLASLLGVNVAGIPGAKGTWAFHVVSLIMIVIAFIEFWIFKKQKWF